VLRAHTILRFSDGRRHRRDDRRGVIRWRSVRDIHDRVIRIEHRSLRRRRRVLSLSYSLVIVVALELETINDAERDERNDEERHEEDDETQDTRARLCGDAATALGCALD